MHLPQLRWCIRIVLSYRLADIRDGVKFLQDWSACREHLQVGLRYVIANRRILLQRLGALTIRFKRGYTRPAWRHLTFSFTHTGASCISNNQIALMSIGIAVWLYTFIIRIVIIACFPAQHNHVRSAGMRTQCTTSEPKVSEASDQPETFKWKHRSVDYLGSHCLTSKKDHTHRLCKRRLEDRSSTLGHSDLTGMKLFLSKAHWSRDSLIASRSIWTILSILWLTGWAGNLGQPAFLFRRAPEVLIPWFTSYSFGLQS